MSDLAKEANRVYQEDGIHALVMFLVRTVDSLIERTAKLATQDDINAMTAALEQVSTDLESVATDLGTTQTAIQTTLNTLAAGNVDTSALQAQVNALGPLVKALDSNVQTLANLTPQAPPTA